jgi:RNA recognition motif-containing protein
MAHPLGSEAHSLLNSAILHAIPYLLICFFGFYEGPLVHNRSRLHVGDLPPDITESALRALFEQVDEVDTVVIPTANVAAPEKQPNYAFVTMKTSEGALKAIQHFNGYVIEGHTLFVYSVPPRSNRRTASNENL